MFEIDNDYFMCLSQIEIHILCFRDIRGLLLNKCNGKSLKVKGTITLKFKTTYGNTLECIEEKKSFRIYSGEKAGRVERVGEEGGEERKD